MRNKKNAISRKIKKIEIKEMEKWQVKYWKKRYEGKKKIRREIRYKKERVTERK